MPKVSKIQKATAEILAPAWSSLEPALQGKLKDLGHVRSTCGREGLLLRLDPGLDALHLVKEVLVSLLGGIDLVLKGGLLVREVLEECDLALQLGSNIFLSGRSRFC